MAHVISWYDIRCRLDELFEQAFNAEKNSRAKNPGNYAKIKEFLEKIFKIDVEAVVNFGAWYPPLTMAGWNNIDRNNPNRFNWFDQLPTKRSVGKLFPTKGN